MKPPRRIKRKGKVKQRQARLTRLTGEEAFHMGIALDVQKIVDNFGKAPKGSFYEQLTPDGVRRCMLATLWVSNDSPLLQPAYPEAEVSRALETFRTRRPGWQEAGEVLIVACQYRAKERLLKEDATQQKRSIEAPRCTS